MIEANKIYSVKEIFLTLQGEGYNTGTPAVFCRFSGCNLWNGIEKDRKKAVCSFCDTDFNGVNGINGGKYKLGDLVKIINSLWPKRKKNKFVVFTGGEPILQLDSSLIKKIVPAVSEWYLKNNKDEINRKRAAVEAAVNAYKGTNQSS